MTFTPDVAAHAGDREAARRELQRVLREIELDTREDPTGALWADYTTGSYAPVRIAFSFPASHGVLSIEGELLALEDEPADELGLAINFLNVELDTFRVYAGEGHDGRAVLIRQDLLPNVDAEPMFHPRELRQVLTGMCAQKQIFADPLRRAASGGAWTVVKDALKAFR